MSVAQSTLELDQDDITARLTGDEVFSRLVTVFSQRKGITENDVMTALGPTNSTNGKAGLVVIVLMPELLADSPDAPGPRFTVRYPIQVIDWPTMRRVTLGTQISAETIAQRIRQVIDKTEFGRGQALYFDGMNPIATTEQTQVSYIVYFKRLGSDPQLVKPATVGISPSNGNAPQVVTLTCRTAGVDIYYTIDGSYPAPNNPAASIYMGPISVGAAVTIRASAFLTGYQQGDVSQAIFGALLGSAVPNNALGGAALAATELGG